MSIAEELIEKGRKEGRQECRQEALNEGALIGRIQVFQEFLGVPVSQMPELASKPTAELQRLVDELRSRLNVRPRP